MAEKKTFENIMADLEKITAELEKGDITLDESLKLFEQGVKASTECQKILDKAEQKVTILLKNQNGDLEEQNFEIKE